jgi:hypothetical protein
MLYHLAQNCNVLKIRLNQLLVRLQGARSPSGRPQQFWQVETFEESEVLRDSAPEQVRHRGRGGVVPPERTRVEDGLLSVTTLEKSN